MFEGVPGEVEARIWRAYFAAHVRPELLSRFVDRWIEVRAGGASGWSSRRTAATVRFARTGAIRLVEPLALEFPCMRGEAEFAAILFGRRGGPREGYARRWTARRDGDPFWRGWEDYDTMVPVRTLLVRKLLDRFVQEGGGCRNPGKRRRV